MDNKKEALYTLKFTESELLDLVSVLHRGQIYFPDNEENDNQEIIKKTDKFINIIEKKRESIVKKRDIYIKNCEKRQIKFKKQIEKFNKQIEEKNND